MVRCKPYRTTRTLFACLLAVALAAIFLTFQSVSSVRRRVADAPGKIQPLQRAQGRRLNDTARHESSAGHALSAVLHTASRNVSAALRATVPFVSLRGNSSALEVSVSVIGMLGNHMFQYASLLGIAHMNGRRPFGAPSLSLDKFFEVTHIQKRPTKGFERVYEKDFASYDPVFEHLPNRSVVVSDFLQSWKYFDAIRGAIKREFTFKQHVKEEAAKLLNKLVPTRGRKVTVGIHVRRGDMATAYSQHRGYHTAPASFLFKAMDYMRHKHGDVVFIVVSDDLSWCRGKLSTVSDCVIADRAPAEVHLALLVSCDHVIMTVGTYGWWGGYLSGGDVVYYWDPKVMLHAPPRPVEIRHPKDFFPPSWVPLPG